LLAPRRLRQCRSGKCGCAERDRDDQLCHSREIP
jgi:hypothetical protein